MIVIVSYELKALRDYSAFYEKLKVQGDWWHYLSSTWLIDTQFSPSVIGENVRPEMGTNDFILIAELGQNTGGWLPKEAWDWINSRKRPSLLGQLGNAPTLGNLGNYGTTSALPSLARLSDLNKKY